MNIFSKGKEPGPKDQALRDVYIKVAREMRQNKGEKEQNCHTQWLNF